jgi:DNA-directed RNA polymerase specialized sigma24 family protein
MLDRQRTLGDGFDLFVATTGEQVRRALVSFYGVEVGMEAAAEAMAVAWQRWDEVAAMKNPGGFLFRVGQSRARPHVRWRRRNSGFPMIDAGAVSDDAAVVDLLRAMRRLPAVQRACVLLVKSYGFSYREAGDILGVTETAVTNHVHRGLTRLRSMMEVTS